MEWLDYEATLCRGCGNPREECFDPANDGKYEAVPLTCFACATRDAEHRNINELRERNKHGDGSFDGLYVSIAEKGNG